MREVNHPREGRVEGVTAEFVACCQLLATYNLRKHDTRTWIVFIFLSILSSFHACVSSRENPAAALYMDEIGRVSILTHYTSKLCKFIVHPQPGNVRNGLMVFTPTLGVTDIA